MDDGGGGGVGWVALVPGARSQNMPRTVTHSSCLMVPSGWDTEEFQLCPNIGEIGCVSRMGV